MVLVFFVPFSFLLWEIFIFLFGSVYVSGPTKYFIWFLSIEPAHLMDTNLGPLGLFI